MVNLNLGQIDLNKKPVKPVLNLCKPNRTTISMLGEAYDVKLEVALGQLSELSFKLPVYRDIHHKLMRNKNFDIIKGRYQIRLKLGNYEEFFIINSVERVDSKRSEYLEVKALSLGLELNDKIIRGYNVISYNAKEILDDILKDTLWTIKYIDSEFLTRYRQMDIASSTVLEVIFEVGKTFNALVVFDTINRTISLHRPEDVGTDRGFSISYGKYLDGLNQEENHEEVITRLKMYGKEEISIHEVNPSGQPYIEDFNYFIYPYKETRNYSSESFTGSQMKNDWNIVGLPSDWSLTPSGDLKLSSNSMSMNIIYDKDRMSEKNIKVTATFKPVDDENEFGIVFKYIDDLNYYYLSYSSYLTDSNNLKLYKVKNGVKTEVASSNEVLGWNKNEEYIMSIECDNRLIKAWIDNVLLINFVDNEDVLGSYGFYGYSQRFELYDVNVDYLNYTIESHSEYMSDELCHHLLKYEDFIKENETVFENLRNQRKVHENHKAILDGELFNLNTELKILLDERDVLNTRIAKKEDEIDRADNRFLPKEDLYNERDSLVAQRDNVLIEIENKEIEIDNKENEIITVQSLIDEVDDKIRLFRIKIDVKNHFPKWILDERNQYIIEKEWQDTNIENPEDLLNEGKKVFEEYRQEKIQLKIDVVNFLDMVSEQRNWDKLNLGDTFGIEHERLKIKYKAKITEIVYDFEKGKIDIVISNVKDLYSNKSKYLEMLYKSYGTSTKVNIKDWEWNLSRENNGMINEIINNFWDANKNAIIGAKDQVIEVSDRGLIIRDPNDPSTYLVGLNSMIAITNDGGNTWKHAITSEGIVGEYIYGKVFMGVNLAIEDESGILKFQGSKGEIFDRDGTLVMKLGLVDENSMCGEAFGMWAFNDITRVKIDDCEGFVIDRANPSELDGWEKVLWANTDGTLYAHDLVASSLKIVHEKDWNKEILNAETGYFDVGWFQNIVKDGKLTTDEKYQLITELHRIYSGYKLLLSQADKYQRVHRDNIVNWNGQFNTSTQSFPTTPSDIDRYSTIPLTNAYIELMEYMKSYIGITSVNPHDPLTINSEDPINEITQEVLPDRATFILKFKNYYDEADKLRNAIEDAIVYQGISMGTNYNNVYMSDYGFIAVRNDGRYRAFLNATNGLALQKWENGMWTNKLFATLGDPMWEDGTLYAEGLVTHNLRIVRANMSDAITFDWYDGITIYGENGEEIRLNANEAISIWTNNDKKFWVGTDGRLYAKDITTHGLKIVDGELGERIILDQENGITINGFSGEQIRLNANEGIAITVNGEKRFWIGNDGLLYAKKLIITEEYDTGIFDYVSGSYISDLTVNKLRTLNDSSPADHVWIADNFIKILTGGANDTAQEKFTLMTTDGGQNIYSAYGAGDQYGNDRGYITKDSDYFIFKYTGMDGQDRKLSMRDSEVDSILLETPHRMRLRGEKLIRIEVDSSNYIEISPNGVKIVGSRIDLN